MYESIKQGLNNSLSLANVQAQNAQRKGQQIGNVASQLGNIVDSGMSAYAQSKANNMQYDMKQELTLKQKDFLNVDNPNASKDYADWVENTINERVEQEGGLAKGYLKEALSGIRDEVRADFDKQLIQKTDSMNKMTIEDTVDKAIKATSKHENIDQYDKAYVYATEYGENGLTITRNKVELGNPYDVDSEELSDEEKRFNQLLNVIYHAYCGMTDQASAKALVDSQIEQIEMKLIHEDALGLINDWGMNGRILDNGQKKYYTPDELKAEIKNMYKQGNAKPYLKSGFSGREFDFEESDELAQYIDGKVDSFYKTLYANSKSTIVFGMKDLWEQGLRFANASKGGIDDNYIYLALANKGLIVYDQANHKVLDHSKIEPSLWEQLKNIGETNARIKLADAWALNPVDFTGDGNKTIDDFILENGSDDNARLAAEMLDFNSTSGQWFVKKEFKYTDMDGNTYTAESTMQQSVPSKTSVELAERQKALLGEINTAVRGLEDTALSALKNLDLFCLDPSLYWGHLNESGEFSETVLTGFEEALDTALALKGLKNPIITDVDKKILKKACEDNGWDYDNALRATRAQRKAIYLAESNGTSYVDILKDVYRNQVFEGAKQSLKDSYNAQSKKLTSYDLWQKNKEYNNPKTFETLDKEASNLINQEIYTHNGIEHIKTKESAPGLLQSYYDKVLSGDWDYAFAQSVARADGNLSSKDTETFCDKKFSELIKKATGNPYIAEKINDIAKQFEDVNGSYHVYQTLASVLYNVKDDDMNSIEQAINKASGQLSSIMATRLDDGMKEYSSSSSTKYTYSVNKGDSNFNDTFTEALKESKERMNNQGDMISIAPAMVDSYINSPSMDFNGQLAFFQDLNKLDGDNKRNRLLVEALHCIGIWEDIKADSEGFAKKFNDILNNYKLSDGDVQLILDIAGDMSNRADRYSDAWANSAGVPSRQDSTKNTVNTDKGMIVSTDGRFFVSQDGKEQISTEFLGESKNGNFTYEPARQSLMKAGQEALDDAYENDIVYQQLLHNLVYNVGMNPKDEEFYSIQFDFEDTGDVAKTKDALAKFFTENPDSPYLEKYNSMVKPNKLKKHEKESIDDFFYEIGAERSSIDVSEINMAIYTAYVNNILMNTEEYKNYYKTKGRLESKEFSTTGSWTLPDMKYEIGRDGRIYDVVKIDR